jgi:uncharacterized protein
LLFIIIAIVFSFIAAPDNFGALRLFSWTVFVHFPLLLILIVLNKKLTTAYRMLAFIKMMTILSVGIYAFFVEPHLLEVNHYTIGSAKVSKPLKIAVISDLQTDNVGSYEEEVLQKTLLEKPDIILFPGDYIQQENKTKREKEYKKLNELLKKINLNAPMGAYAVRGNVEHNDWPLVFENTGIYCFNQTHSLQLNNINITGLSLFDSFNTSLLLPSTDSVFSIVFGHAPDFALSSPPADLLIAGHTHGGQVQIPFFGPVFTLSDVPRNWASGITRINPNTTLVVSKGIGMERENAPRLRFFCKPEIVLINIIPE